MSSNCDISCIPIVNCPPECIFEGVPLDQAILLAEDKINKYCVQEPDTILCAEASKLKHDLILNYDVSGVNRSKTPVHYNNDGLLAYLRQMNNIKKAGIGVCIAGHMTLITSLFYKDKLIEQRIFEAGYAGVVVGFAVYGLGALYQNTIDTNNAHETVIENSSNGVFPIPEVLLNQEAKESSAKNWARRFCTSEYWLTAGPFKLVPQTMEEKANFKIYAAFECVTPLEI